MKKLFLLLALLLGFAGSINAQGVPNAAPGNVGPYGANCSHNEGGLYYAVAYATWSAKIVSGNSTTGSGASITVSQPSALCDGYVPNIGTVYGGVTGAVFPKIIIADSVAETITPTAVTVGTCPTGSAGPINSQCATITATINNTHGGSALLLSGDGGIAEAINDSGFNGGGPVLWQVDTGIVTLSTSGLTTTTTTFVPSQFVSLTASARVTTTITTTTNWAVGITGSTGAFCTANATLTAGTTCIANYNNPTTVGTTLSLTAVLVTTTVANPGAGAVKMRLWGITPVNSFN